jgi:hypothetical protein
LRNRAYDLLTKELWNTPLSNLVRGLSYSQCRALFSHYPSPIEEIPLPSLLAILESNHHTVSILRKSREKDLQVIALSNRGKIYSRKILGKSDPSLQGALLRGEV